MLVRSFAFRIYRIPSASMHGSLFEGDYVVIDKLRYGARMPYTPLALKVSGEYKYLDWLSFSYHRLPGPDDPERGDVVAFNHSLDDSEPIDLREEYVKRCVAVPGDTLRIIRGNIIVNGSPEKCPSRYKEYKSETGFLADTRKLKSTGIDILSVSEDGRRLRLAMTIDQAALLKKSGIVLDPEQVIYPATQYHPSVFPNHPEIKWNEDNFGPVFIPGKGDSVLLDKTGLLLYKRTIEKYEGVDLPEFQKDSTKKYYTFRQNYFFLIGDNFHNSIDSRIFGFIPEDHIIGKATWVLFSPIRGKNFLSVK